MAFKTKLDYSSNRQIKQQVKTITILSGGTSFGVVFSALTSGPNLLTSAITESYSLIASTFSGNSGTTNYSWYDPRMELGKIGLSALTLSNSGVTQNTLVFTANTKTVIDGNTSALTYSGVSFDISNIMIVSLGSGNYSGTVQTNNLNIISASSLDYLGRTIWSDVSGISRTERLIITSGASIGKVWTCTDTEGMGYWGNSSTGGTSNSVWTAGTGNSSAVLSGSNNNATGNFSVAEGSGTTASGDLSHASGYRSLSSGNSSHAEGGDPINSYSGGTASGIGSHAEGILTTANGHYSHAEGSLTIAGGSTSHAEGDATSALGLSSHSEGQNTLASGNSSHAEGDGSIASGPYSHAEGKETIASGSYAHVENDKNYALGDFTHAGGRGVNAYGDGSFVHFTGFRSNFLEYGASGTSSVILGGRLHKGYTGTTDSAIIGGSTNIIEANVQRSVILGGEDLSATTNDYVYVPSLNIKTVGSSAFVNDIRIDANGNLTTNTSDIRFKENINNITNALSLINQLQGVTYQWIDRNSGGDTVKLGFIAQSVEEIVPDLVFTNQVDGYKGLHIDGIIPLLVEAVKELASGSTTSNNTHLETQTILAEDNNIELNHKGTNETAIGGGIIVLYAKDNDEPSKIITNSNGDFITNCGFIPETLTIPKYTPQSSNDTFGDEGNITRDDNYLYIRTISGWKRINLENF